MNRHSSFILNTSHCYNIRPTLLINPVLRLVLETALVKRFKPLYANTKHSDDGYVHSIVVHSGGIGEDAALTIGV